MFKKYFTAAIIGLWGLAAAYEVNGYTSDYFREQRELDQVKVEGIRIGTEYYHHLFRIRQSKDNFCKHLFEVGDNPVKYRTENVCIKV